MSDIKLCDICKRNSYDCDGEIIEYAIKRKRLISGKWQYLDICADCLREIKKKAKESTK